MSEAKLSTKVLQTLRPLDAIPVDNPRKPGTPDINYIEGWIELKWLPDWPKRAATTVKFPKFRPEQRVWLVKRSKRGGVCFVFVQIKFMYLLYEGELAALYFDKLTKTEMIKAAYAVWDHYPEDELVKTLQWWGQ